MCFETVQKIQIKFNSFDYSSVLFDAAALFSLDDTVGLQMTRQFQGL